MPPQNHSLCSVRSLAGERKIPIQKAFPPGSPSLVCRVRRNPRAFSISSNSTGSTNEKCDFKFCIEATPLPTAGWPASLRSCKTTDKFPPGAVMRVAFSRHASVRACSKISAAWTSSAGAISTRSCERSTRCSSSPRKPENIPRTASRYDAFTSSPMILRVTLSSMRSSPFPPAIPSIAADSGRHRRSASAKSSESAPS